MEGLRGYHPTLCASVYFATRTQPGKPHMRADMHGEANVLLAPAPGLLVAMALSFHVPMSPWMPQGPYVAQSLRAGHASSARFRPRCFVQLPSRSCTASRLRCRHLPSHDRVPKGSFRSKGRPSGVRPGNRFPRRFGGSPVTSSGWETFQRLVDPATSLVQRHLVRDVLLRHPGAIRS